MSDALVVLGNLLIILSCGFTLFIAAMYPITRRLRRRCPRCGLNESKGNKFHVFLANDEDDGRNG